MVAACTSRALAEDACATADHILVVEPSRALRLLYACELEGEGYQVTLSSDLGGPRSRPTYTPAVDIREEPDALVLVADMPGVEAKNVDLSVSASVLTIRGERKEAKDKDLHRVERWSGSFHRSVPLPCEVDIEKADAKFKDGVLTLVLPKAASAERKPIEVKTE